MKMEQLTLWSESREEKLEREMKELRESHEKVRKGQFAKISQLAKMYSQLEHEFEILKQSICRSS